MAIVFKELFRVELSHVYYAKGSFNDFDITPTPDTEEFLRKQKMRFRSVQGGIEIFVKADGNNTFIPIRSKYRLSFALLLKNPFFMNFTELDNKTDRYDIHHLETKTNSQNLNYSTVKLRPALFTETFTNNKSGISFKIKNSSNEIILDEQAIKNKNEQILSIDMGEAEEGNYKLQAFRNNKKVFQTDFYFSNFLYSKRPFGLLAIDIKKNQKPNNTKLLNYKFQTKQHQWIYNVALSKDYLGYDIALDDTREEDIQGEPYPYSKFKEVTNPSKLEKGKTLVFKSVKASNQNKEQPIPFLEMPHKDLQLKLSKDGVDLVIPNLPNPVVNSPKTEVFLKV